MSANVVPFRRSLHSAEAERTVIGAALVDPGRVLADAATLSPEDFYRDCNRALWSLVLRMADDRRPIDLRSVAEAVLRDPERFGGMAYVGSLTDDLPSTHVRHWVGIIRDHAERRALVERCRSAIDLTEGMAPLEEARAALDTDAGPDDGGFQGARELASDGYTRLLRDIERRQQGRTVTVPMPFERLGRVLRFPRDEGALLILAARPGMGKTAMMLELVRKVAGAGIVGDDGRERQGSALVFSLEMPADQLIRRMAGQWAGLDMRKVEAGYGSREELDALHRGYEYVSGLRLWIDDTPGRTVSDIRRRVRRHIAQHGPVDMVAVDYLGLIDHRPLQGERGDQCISRGVRDLRNEARANGYLQVLLSQLNRGVESRADKRPMLSDLRDSGGIEEHAEAVVMLYRDEYYTREMSAYPGECDVLVRKNRHGPSGTVVLGFDGPATRFHENVPERG